MVIKSSQIDQLDKYLLDSFVKRAAVFIIDFFDRDYVTANLKGTDFDFYIRRNIQHAQKFGLSNEDSICAYILLSLKNGEHFLDKPEFKALRAKLTNGRNKPDEYIFQIPITNQVNNRVGS